MVLAELVVRLIPGGGVRLQVGETFVDLSLVTHTGDPTAVWITQGRHQVGGGGGGGGGGLTTGTRSDTPS